VKQLVRAVAVLGIVAVPAAAHAQVSGGVRAGVNLANLSIDNSPPFDLENLAGLVAGGFLTLPLNGVFAFQPEVLYSRQGAKFHDQDVTARTKIDYVQVPALARVRLGTRSPLSVLFGPSFGFKTGARFSTTGTPTDDSQDLGDQIKGFDFGLAAGAGLDVGHLVVDARYTWGLTNIAKAAANPTDQDHVKNRVLSLSIGVRF